MLTINNFLEYLPDADMAEIVMRHTEMRHTDFNQRFPREK